MCLFPRLMFNPKYKANKKNGGHVPPVFDKRVLAVPIGCQVCIECRKQRANNWRVRLFEDLKMFKNARFVTLTFSNESIKKIVCDYPELMDNVGYDLDNAIAGKAVRLFLERWRKEFKVSVRHWFITELGHSGTENVHLHGIIWTDKGDRIADKWGYGYVWNGYDVNGSNENYVNEKTINYVMKYVTKADVQHVGFIGKVFCSKGIGGSYNVKVNKFNGDKTADFYRCNNGAKIGLPIYYRNKAYSEKERELLWIMKIDKEERFVLGEKISIKKGLGDYYNVVGFYRGFFKKLGYEDPDFVWKKKEYEEQRRALLLKKRLV